MEEEPCSDRFHFTQGSQIGRKPPDVMNREHQRFRKRLSHVLKGSPKLASNKKELEQRIREIGDHSGGSNAIGERAVAEFNHAAERQESFQQQGEGGSRRANAVFQESLFAISRFAAAYSSILEAVSKASGPYGEIGYQTMTILLIVFVNKKTNDDKIEAHLNRIQKTLPRLDVWKGIYHHEEMTKLVSETYHLVIQFSRAAANYFCRRWTRVWLALNPLAMSGKIDDLAQSIYETLAEVNAEANQSLHARSQEIYRTVTVLQTEIDKRDKRDDDERFRTLEEGLSRNAMMNRRQCFDVSIAKDTLKTAFPNVKERSSAIVWSMYTFMTPARILSHPSFLAWAESEASALLFIHGETRREGRASTITMPCWISPAAIHIVEHLASFEQTGLGTQRIIYFSCRPDHETSIGDAADVPTLVALRLLSTRKSILRDQLKEFQGLIPSVSPVSSQKAPPSFPEPETVLKQRRKFLTKVLAEFDKEQRDKGTKKHGSVTAYIVLDRLDCIDENVRLKKFLRELLYLANKKSGFCVKIVAVAEARLQENEWKRGIPQDVADQDQVFEVKMDQRELNSKDMASEKQQLLWKD